MIEKQNVNSDETSGIKWVVLKTRLQLGANMGRKVTQEQFGEMLVEGLINVPLSRTSVSAWENGIYEPDSDLLWALAVRHYGTRDWRLLFAMNCLRAKLPDIFEAGIVTVEIPVAG